MLIKLISLCIFFSVIILLIGGLVKALVVLKQTEEGITPDNLADYINQLEIIRLFQSLDKSDLDTLFRVSRNPWNMTKLIWILIKYVGTPVAVGAAVLAYGIFGEILVSVVLLVVAGFCLFYPTGHYKAIIKERERAWNKMYSHVWRISNLLDDYDPKKCCIEMRDYFNKVGEGELAYGFEAFYEMWPEDFNSIPEAMEEFALYFPFEIPKDLFYVLLECWRNSSPANERLDNFRKNCELRYEKFSSELLSKVPSRATMLSLPFLMISVMAAILFPALLNILTALG